MRFDEFMRRALYDPEHGYYRRRAGQFENDPFGKDGDFFTASQLQPLFGRVIAAEAHTVCPGGPFYELGPGRREMSEYVSVNYTGIEVGDELPMIPSGFLFANEFFDALPVRLGVKRDEALYELLGAGCELARGPQLDCADAAYVNRYWPFVEDGGRFEIGVDALTWIDRIGARMQSGCALFIDYGYTTAETIRFPQGTVMSYRRHRATPAILENPGGQDITAHVAFDALTDRAAERAFDFIRMETLSQLVLRAVEREPALIATVLGQKQLKTLLFGMGETFRCLWLKKSAEERGAQ